MMQRSIFTPAKQATAKDYSFKDQELDYALFRPVWPQSFAITTLEQADINYHTAKPVVVIIGSGAGADAKPFLELGCIVYAIEPNQMLRRLAVEKFVEFNNFHSIDGNAHTLNLPTNLKADLIVCAQALHTFSGEIIGNPNSEGEARRNWQAILPDDRKNRISIWYYNIDPILPCLMTLHKALITSCQNYANSKTQFLDATMFEPEKFQHYIKNSEMIISAAKHVDETTLTATTYLRWLRSYSFFPKDEDEIKRVTAAMNDWFATNKNDQEELQLTYIGFIAQGPLRSTPYLKLNGEPTLSSPITYAARITENSNTPEHNLLGIA